uniref:Uncharacterized protein n=1 Tax=Candidatus Kentrum sp. LPFa TaxID=2126335 RepID=A0A450VV37_9GAMM|nr:MAG: hypothetical protein BECKLPF1236A_GA0070988_100191 [Candidatus Kentron sp. LPFa]VFK24859.1 MAG: hypothetical protein BECKLPF1236C_GA0070990_100171 [Candidatus Kentron sp. LPFa]
MAFRKVTPIHGTLPFTIPQDLASIYFIGPLHRARRCSDSSTDTPHCSSTTYPGSGSCSPLSGTISRNSNSLFCLFSAQLRRRVEFCKMPICFANAKSRLVGVRRSFAKNGTKPLHGYRHGTTDDALDDLLCGGCNSISCCPLQTIPKRGGEFGNMGRIGHGRVAAGDYPRPGSREP